MGLQAILKTLDGVPEALQEHYKETESGFALEVDEKDFKGQLDEFRTNNRKLYGKVQRLEADMKKYDGVDPAKYAQAEEALKKLKKIEEESLIGAGKLDEVVEARVKQMRTDFETQTTTMKTALDKAEKDRNQFQTQLSEMLIESSVLDAVNEVGSIRKGAKADVLARAHSSFQVGEDGKSLVPKNASGDTIYNSKGEPMTPGDWAQGLVKDASFLFEPSGGGGSNDKDRKPGEGKAEATLVDPDADTFGANLEAIASGKTEVVKG